MSGGGAMSRPRILYVEDEPSILEPMARALDRAGFEPLTARTAREALALDARLSPDLLLLDLALPDGDGRDICREVRRRRDVPVIMLTARGTETDRIVGLEIGADDYVVKPFSSAEVIARIRAVLRRTARPEPDGGELVVDDLRVDPAARRAWRGEEELELSRREFDLLVRLMRDAGRVVTRESLMDDVWDVNWYGSTKTLDVHIGWLRRKLGDDPQAPRYIHTVRGIGFRFSAPGT
jgi:two-component system, OmpR family, response regulator RegX3